MLLFWDKASHHRAKMVREYAKKHDIVLEVFPTAVPEENPAEQAWNTLAAATANAYYKDYDALLWALKRGTRVKNVTKMFKYFNH